MNMMLLWQLKISISTGAVNGVDSGAMVIVTVWSVASLLGCLCYMLGKEGGKRGKARTN